MQIERVRQKLFKLKDDSRRLLVFGSSNHQYKIFPIKSENQLQEFENKHKIKIPEGYREFLKSIGNGIAGPYYGLESLESTLFSDLDYKDNNHLIDPSNEFPLTEKWNLNFDNLEDEEYYNKKDEEYFEKKWSNGLLRISNFGCGVSINLVVNGAEYGNIWIDDRCNDGGIYPEKNPENNGRVDFLTWYENWLDKSLQDIAK